MASASIESLSFPPLALDGANYFSWASDVHVYFQSKELGLTIMQESERQGRTVTVPVNYAALFFLRRHIHANLKTQYDRLDNAFALWTALKARFDHHKAINLP